jgi:hypothetical protein
MKRISLLVLCVLSIAATRVSAQRVWIVDRSNGPGADFTDLPPALEAAADGDTIVVRQGVYANAVTSRSVTLLGVGTPMLSTTSVGPSGEQRALLVHGLPAGGTFSMRGFRLNQGAAAGSITAEIRDCSGHVVLADVSTSSSAVLGAALLVVRSRDVTLNQCYSTGGMRGEDSSIALRDSRFFGEPATLRSGSLFNIAYPALRAARCDLSICAGTFQGGSGFEGLTPDASAMELEACATRISTGWQLSLRTGVNTAAPEFVVSANLGTIDLDASIPLSIGGTVAVTRRWIPSMHALPATIGSVLPLELFAEPGSAYQIFLGLLGAPIPLPPFGTLWIEPTTILPFAAGRLDLTGSTIRGFVLPNDPLLQGLALRAQALVLTGGSAALSDPGVAVIY